MHYQIQYVVIINYVIIVVINMTNKEHVLLVMEIFVENVLSKSEIEDMMNNVH